MGHRHSTPRRTTPDSQVTTRSSAPDITQPGLVIAHFGRDVVVEDASGQLHQCSARKKLGRIVCGDRVRWQVSGPEQGVVTALDARTSLLARPDPRGEERPLAANVDQLIIVCAPEPPLSEALIDRYLVVAELIGARPLILVNKADLLAPAARARLEERLATFTRLGYPVLFTSTRDNAQVTALMAHTNGHTSILVGQSGVGKSSLVHLLVPDAEIRVGQLSVASGLGKHTTTETTLYHLAGGGDLIDSPGVRDFQLWQATTEDLQRGFRELCDYQGQCRFMDCRHNGEPGCAVAAAVESGNIDSRRLGSYRTLLQQALLRERERFPT
ncbi:MAG: ribosome small subunit-dependent GTPase A [Gammaproteobacteria bacterium]|nr:ribosome small subunit-dependent GTPase A [Gammaproteobacteria bacterium]